MLQMCCYKFNHGPIERKVTRYFLAVFHLHINSENLWGTTPHDLFGINISIEAAMCLCLALAEDENAKK
jgi:hypothetical protein